ncbi:MAG TPA: hypothetical protein VH661_00660 [Candidatus Dormibacteraeota bacterium]|nr:hypothetical protein [Candidatus Dormibacteraeota bacterium]
MRRAALRGLTCAAAVVALAGCGPAVSPTVAPTPAISTPSAATTTPSPIPASRSDLNVVYPSGC